MKLMNGNVSGDNTDLIIFKTRRDVYCFFLSNICSTDLEKTVLSPLEMVTMRQIGGVNGNYLKTLVMTSTWGRYGGSRLYSNKHNFKTKPMKVDSTYPRKVGTGIIRL